MLQTLGFYKRLTSKYSTNFVANAGQQGFRFLLLYLSAKVLGPKEFATLSFILLISTYLMNANGGAINGVKRQIPLSYLKRGGAFTLNAFFSIFNFNILCTLVFAAVAAVAIYVLHDYGIVASILLFFLSVATNVFFSIQAYFTATGKWRHLSALQMLCAFLLVGAVISLYYANFIILVIAYIISYLFPCLFFFYTNGYKTRWNKKIIRENVGIGFPVMISGFIYLLFQTSDRLIISYYYSAEQFGFYSFAWVLVMSLNLISNMSSEIILQRSATRFSHLQDRGDLFSFVTKYSFLVLAVMAVIALLLVAVVQSIIPEYLAAYEPSIPVIRNLIIAYLIQQFAIAPANYYFIIGKQWIYNLMLLIACLGNILILLAGVMYYNPLPEISTLSALYVWSSLLYTILLYLPILKRRFVDGTY